MRKAAFLVCLIILSFFSCRKELEKPYWDTEILAPLVNASLDINNILPDSILQINPDSSLKIVFQNDIYKLAMDTLFKIPDTTLNKVYPMFSVKLPPGQVVIPNNQIETSYNLKGIQLRVAIIKSGLVRYTIKNYIHEVTDFVYTIPSAKLNNVPFSINISVPAAVGTTPGIFTKVYDLSGYVFSLTGINGNKINTLYTALTASISASATDSVQLSSSESLVIENEFYDIQPYYTKGYFGQNTFNIGPEQTDFTMFNRIVGGAINLEDVNFNLKIENPIGIDARAYISNLSSINTRTGNTINLSNSIIGSAININRAAESGGNVFPTSANFPLTISNSNIKNLIENLPDKFGYTMQVNTNPLGNVSGSNDFIYSDKLLNVRLDMEIPLSLVASNLILTDTFNLAISNSNGVKNVHSGTVTLFANNGFPFDAAMQFYLLNENNVVVDSLLGYANTIDEASVNSSYRVIAKKLTKIVVPVSESKMNLLYNTKKVMLKVKFNTGTPPQYMKIYSDYKIDIKLVGDFNYTIQLQ
ncbi:MAG: hypothetical protein ACT4ON_12450 [Bacteroidota bacterium]